MKAHVVSANKPMTHDKTLGTGDAAREYETTEVAFDCYFKVIDISYSGQAIEDRGECFSNRQLESYYSTVPQQPENTVRLILDGRHRRVRLSRDVHDAVPNAYPHCSSRLGSNHIHHTPSPNPLYTSPSVISDSFRYHHLPTLRNLGEQNEDARWYGIYCFASHIEDCPSLSRRLHPLQSTFERSGAYFTVCQNDKGLSTSKSYPFGSILQH